MSDNILQHIDKNLYTLGGATEIGLRNKLRHHARRIPVSLLGSLWAVANEESVQDAQEQTLSDLQAYSGLLRNPFLPVYLTSVAFEKPLAVRDAYERPTTLYCSPTWPSNSSPLHRFELRRAEDGSVVLASCFNGHVIDTYWDDDRWRTHLWPYHGGLNQRWQIALDRALGHSFTLTSMASGERLDAYEDGGGISVHTYAPHEGANQRWWFAFE